MSEIIPGIYRHFKGKQYRVLGVAKHSETLEPLVVYEALYDNPESQLWVRPVSLFTEVLGKPDYQGPRFTYVGEDKN